jgi:hypothetical protein
MMKYYNLYGFVRISCEVVNCSGMFFASHETKPAHAIIDRIGTLVASLWGPLSVLSLKLRIVTSPTTVVLLDAMTVGF